MKDLRGYILDTKLSNGNNQGVVLDTTDKVFIESADECRNHFRYREHDYP